MSAVKTEAMRHQEDFPLPLDLFSLNLEDYDFEGGRNIAPPHEVDVTDWLSNGSPLSSVFQDVQLSDIPPEQTSADSEFHFKPEETHLDLQYVQLLASGHCSSIAGLETQPGHVTPGHVTPGHVTPGHVTPGHVTPGRVTPGHVTPGHVTPITVMPITVTPGHVTPGALSSSTPAVSPLSSHPSSPRTSVSSAKDLSAQPPTKQKIPRHKRKSHIDAEQRRRSKIQTAFDDLKLTVPSLSENSRRSSKDSKAAMLNKTVDFCRELRQQNRDLKREADKLRQEMQVLTSEITEVQTRLPAVGLERVSMETDDTQGTSSVESMFEDYLRARTLANWKFWIFGLVIRPLFSSYNRSVVTSSMEGFCSSVTGWVQSHLSLVQLRPALLGVLKYMSTNTSIMTAPERVEKEAIQAAISCTLTGDRLADIDTSTHDQPMAS